MLFCRQEHSVFATGLIAGVLTLLNNTYPSNETDRARRKALAFLAANKEANRPLWRYWTKDDPNYVLIGPDLDDTSVIASVLFRNGSGFRDIRSFLRRYRTQNGLFRTWIDHEGGIDCVVNANVLYYFSLRQESLPAVCAYLNREVKRQPLPNCSQYYAPGSSLYYFASRAYAEAGAACLSEAMPELKSRLIEQKTADNPLEQALAISSLINSGSCGGALESQVPRLLEKQQPDGRWAMEAFFKGPKLSYFGSPVLTTAMALEAILKYQVNCL